MYASLGMNQPEGSSLLWHLLSALPSVGTSPWNVRLSSFCQWSSCIPKAICPVSGQVGTGSLVCLLANCCSFYQASLLAGTLTALSVGGWSSPRRSWAVQGRLLHPYLLHHPLPSSLRLWEKEAEIQSSEASREGG